MLAFLSRSKVVCMDRPLIRESETTKVSSRTKNKLKKSLMKRWERRVDFLIRPRENTRSMNSMRKTLIR